VGIEKIGPRRLLRLPFGGNLPVCVQQNRESQFAFGHLLRYGLPQFPMSRRYGHEGKFRMPRLKTVQISIVTHAMGTDSRPEYDDSTLLAFQGLAEPYSFARGALQ
jgi:hypothetical protein